MDTEYKWGCGSCGAALSDDDFEDFDDLQCPECGSHDIYNSDDEDEFEAGYR